MGEANGVSPNGKSRGEPLSVALLHDPTVATPEHLPRRPSSEDSIQTGHVDVGSFQSAIRLNRILCIGAGYVGGPTMAVIASKCPDIEVYVVDISRELINRWNSDRLPVYEPGLDVIVKECRGRNLFFSTFISEGIRDCDIIFIAVNTPTKQFGIGKGLAADLTAWENACRSVAAYSDSHKIVIEKSTVPVRTAERSYRILKTGRKHSSIHFVVLSNPEFLAEGTAIRNLEFPDRVLIGGLEHNPVSTFALSVLVRIYQRWVPDEKILTTNLWSSELSKLVANAFLAQRVSSINTVAMLCEKTGADVREVARAVGLDSRIGSKYLDASVGFGGSCLQKDVLSLSYICDFYGLKEAAQYWKMVKEMNDLQKSRFTQRIIHGLFDTVNKKKIAVLGFSFKKNTADTRGTPAVDVCIALMNDGALVHVYDPQVPAHAAWSAIRDHGGVIDGSIDIETQFCVESTAEAAVVRAHAIIVLTEWDEFQDYNYDEFFRLMVKPAFVFDGRNLLDHKKLAEIGFEVHGVGVCPCLIS